jgi:hypothetical protein
MKTELSNAELQEHLVEQLEFLERSASSFDEGFEGEIKRLAVAVRVLVHDTGNSTSLLTLLNQKDVDFVDTSIPYEEANLLSHSGLVQISIGNRPSKPLPLLDDGPFSRVASFNLWWNGIVFVDKDKNEFSRKDIALSLANKEGGAHIDKSLDKKYAELRKNNSLACADVTSDGKQTPSADQVPATMRQIAHETLKTLKKNYSCHREKNSDDGVFIMGSTQVVGNKLPPIPAHNLPKNRLLIAGVKIGRNARCPCGSGKKYKKCCLR